MAGANECGGRRVFGFVAAEIVPPVAGVQDLWTVTCRFKSPAELANWPGSEIRKRLLGEEVAHNFRNVREYAMSGGARVDSGYTRVIARKVRAGKDGRHEIDALVERGARQV